MSHKRQSEVKNHGSTNNPHSHLLEISAEVELTDEGEERLEFKKPIRVSPVTVFKYCGAAVCLITMVASWIALAEKIQGLQDDYPHTYFLTYWVHSFYSLLYVAWKVWRIFPGGYKCNSVGDGSVTPRKMLFISGYMGVVSLVSGYLWYLSLPKTSVAVSTSLYQSSSTAVFVLSIFLLGESVTLVKMISLMMSIGGVCMVAIFSTRGSDHHSENSNSTFNSSNNDAGDEPHNTITGIVYLLLSMMTYGLFEVSAKKWLAPAGDTAPMANSVRGLGMIGVHTLLWMWPPIIIWHYTGFEVFSWPSRYNLEMMVLSAFLDLTFNASLLMCISLVSPLFASVGAILAIPTAMLWDYFTKHYTENNLAYVGIALIIIGFVGFVISEVVTEKKKHKTTLSVLQKSTVFKKPTFGWI